MGVIYLVKHAQASVDASAPAHLTPMGWQQGQRLGASLAVSRVQPDLVAGGTLPRHRETIAAMTDEQPLDVLEDEGWNEYDHLSVLGRHEPEFGDRDPSRAEFQEWTEQACRRWASGDHDGDYAETFEEFTGRIARAKLALVSRMPADGSAVVVTCGGPIAWITTALWSGWNPGEDPHHLAQAWSRINSVVMNTAVTKVALAPRGLTLVSFNDHAHLERSTLTYR